MGGEVRGSWDWKRRVCSASRTKHSMYLSMRSRYGSRRNSSQVPGRAWPFAAGWKIPPVLLDKVDKEGKMVKRWATQEEQTVKESRGPGSDDDDAVELVEERKQYHTRLTSTLTLWIPISVSRSSVLLFGHKPSRSSTRFTYPNMPIPSSFFLSVHAHAILVQIFAKSHLVDVSAGFGAAGPKREA